jgi:RNA polymerase sigma-70 factor (ECF subfamily)
MPMYAAAHLRLAGIPMLETLPIAGEAFADPQADLLLDVAVGDRTAFERLYRLASPRLFAICLRVLSDRAEAEDVLQDVFATIWHKAEQFDPARAGAGAWMAMIARNRAIVRLRAPAHAARTTAIELGDELPDNGTTPID